VTARVTKHLCFSFQPTNRVLNEKLYVFPFDDHACFAVLQSRVHVPWAWLLSSTLEERLNYSASDCFETFPFPHASRLAALEEPGRTFDDARAAYMVSEQVGLTITYNRMKDPSVIDARIEELRRLTLAMDRAVLAAYGWDDLEPPHFTTPETDAQRRVAALFDDTVIDRLFALNGERAKLQGSVEPHRSMRDDDDEPPQKSGRGTRAKARSSRRRKSA
jgi:hypothetical protein